MITMTTHKDPDTVLLRHLRPGEAFRFPDTMTAADQIPAHIRVTPRHEPAEGWVAVASLASGDVYALVDYTPVHRAECMLSRPEESVT